VFWVLEVLSQAIQLGQQKVNVALGDRGAGYDVPEEVWYLVQWLIANHQRADLHHFALQNRRDL